MQILADYHTHTVYSHGKGTIEDNVREAISKGIKTIGISDHGYKHMTYGIKYKDIYKMREEIDSLKLKYKNIDILLGIECNILDDSGNIDVDENILKVVDYIMAGYHFGSTPTSIKGVINHCDNYLFKTKKAKQYNTKAITNAMRKHNIFAITHPGDKGEVDIVEISKVAKETDTRLEINGGHGFLSVKQIEAIKSIKNKYIIGSDAHVPENVGNFDLAMKIIEEANLDVSLVENIKI